MRLVLTALAVAVLSSSASAKLARPKEEKLFSGKVTAGLSLTSVPTTQSVPVEPPAEAVMTKSTRIFLDGAEVAFAKVPATAAITKMELDADGKTIIRIEFQSAK